jgi:hypothetical protein
VQVKAQVLLSGMERSRICTCLDGPTVGIAAVKVGREGGIFLVRVHIAWVVVNLDGAHPLEYLVVVNEPEIGEWLSNACGSWTGMNCDLKHE